VVYGYFIPAIREEAKQYLKNMNFFLRHGVADSETVDFLFLRIEGSDDDGVGEMNLRRWDSQSDTMHPFSQPPMDDSIEWFRVQHLPNVYLCSAVNLGADICSYREFFHDKSQATPRPLDHYKYFFFLNCGVRGPFFYPPPPISLSPSSTEVELVQAALQAARKVQATKVQATHPAHDQAQAWLQKFTSKLGDDAGGGGVSLIGPTVSCELSPHVQSYALAMTSATYRNFADAAWSGCRDKDKAQIIVDAEVGLSKAVLEAGLRVASFYPQHQGIGNTIGSGGGTFEEWSNAILSVRD
jgi:hypothetical protein